MKNLSIYAKSLSSLFDKRKIWTVDTVLNILRKKLQFTSIPDHESLAEGIVDCVGATYCAKLVFESLFIKDSFYAALVPKYPWTKEISNDNNHVVLVRLTNERKVQIIDPTPINGYGYGKASILFDQKNWFKQDGIWTLDSEIQQSLDWEQFLYPILELIEASDMSKMISVSQMKSDLFKKKQIIDLGQPTGNGWKKDYYRVLAKNEMQKLNFVSAKFFLLKALEFTPSDPYLLREIISSFDQISYTSEFKNEIIEREKCTTERIIAVHNHAISMWEKKKNLAEKSENWKDYLYYIGCIFWRRQSINLLNKNVLEHIPSFQYNHKLILIYQLLPAWFSKNKMKVIVSPEKISDYLYSSVYRIQNQNRIALNYSKIKICNDHGYVSVVENDFNATVGQSFYALDAHNCLFSLVKPNLLIV